MPEILLLHKAQTPASGDLKARNNFMKLIISKPQIPSFHFREGCLRRLGCQGVVNPRDEGPPHTDLVPGLQCCRMHDRCYGELEENGCSIWTQSYDYRFIQGLVVCEYTSYCPGKLCDCDRKLVYCLRRNLWSYNPLYQYYPNFLC
nr:phospholipase A2 group V isoform X3 [Peromyscus maniculatus bairdii]